MYCFKIAEAEIKRLSEETGTTSFAVISSILAKSVERAFAIERGNIRILLPVNLRAMYGSSSDMGQSVADNALIRSMEEVFRENGIAYTLAAGEAFPEIYYLK